MPWLVKTTLAFAGQEQGWSETFYWESPSDDLTLAASIIGPIARKRADLLASTYTLTVIRNSLVLNNAGAAVKRMSDIIEPRFTGVLGWDPAAPQLSLLAEWQNALANKSKLTYMRGIPSNLGDIGKTPNTSWGSWLSRWNQYVTAMRTLPAGWLTTGVAQSAVVTNWVLNAQTGQVTLTLGGAGLNWPVGVGQQIRTYISIPGRSPLDGPQLVVVVSNTSCYTVNPMGIAPHETSQVGTIQLRNSSLVTLGAAPGSTATGLIDPRRIVSHKTGRPTYASRGRVAARPLW